MPPWQRAWAARDDRDLNNIGLLGEFLWMIGVAAAATMAARSIQRRPAARRARRRRRRPLDGSSAGCG
ncbi:hypothetical protein ACFQ3Z_39255 [Streptomyces nogalater]